MHIDDRKCTVKHTLVALVNEVFEFSVLYNIKWQAVVNVSDW